VREFTGAGVAAMGRLWQPAPRGAGLHTIHTKEKPRRSGAKNQEGINASRLNGDRGRFGAGRAPLVPLPHVPRFQKQSVFDLSGCGLDASAALGGEDHQLRGMLPRTALLDMLGLLEDERSHIP